MSEESAREYEMGKRIKELETDRAAMLSSAIDMVNKIVELKDRVTKLDNDRCNAYAAGVSEATEQLQPHEDYTEYNKLNHKNHCLQQRIDELEVKLSDQRKNRIATIDVVQESYELKERIDELEAENKKLKSDIAMWQFKGMI